MFKSIPIRVNIITNICIITLIGVSLVMLVQLFYSKKMAVNAAEDLFVKISTDIGDRLYTMDADISSLISYLEESNGITDQPSDTRNIPLERLLTKMMTANDIIYNIYVGHSNGSFAAIVNLKISGKTLSNFSAPEDARWALIKIQNRSGIRKITFLNDDLNIVGTKTTETSFEVTERPWYKDAMAIDGVQRTKPYLFESIKSKGITYTKRLNSSSNAVLGVDITLNKISEFVEKAKVFDEANVIILDESDSVLTATNSYNQALIASVIQTASDYNNVRVVTFKKVKYLVKVSKFNNSYLKQEKIIVAIPLSVMNAHYYKLIKLSLLVTLALSVILVPLIFISSNLMEKPLRELMKENSLISQRRFREVGHVKTVIKEYQELSASIVHMAGDIESFQLSQQHLFDSFVRLLAQAIDDKSAYTGGHCSRVPILCESLAMAASECSEGIFKDYEIKNLDQWRELQISAWLHDCGKLVIPEYVVDKATRLETIYNRIHEIRTRFEIIWRDLEIKAYQMRSEGMDREAVSYWLKDQHDQLIDDFNFIAEKNDGDNFVNDKDIERIKQIASREWIRHFDDSIGLSYEESQRRGGKSGAGGVEKLLADRSEHIIPRSEKERELFENNEFKMDIPEHLYNLGEIYNLSVGRGTLTAEERFKINEHIIMTIKMLGQMPFPDTLSNVPEYACAHHETMIGTGYPRGLKKEDMSIPARIMAIADIFEALTAADRPYKKAKTLSESIKILSFMAKDGHIDDDIFKLFISSGVYKEYADEYLSEDQIDEVDESLYI